MAVLGTVWGPGQKLLAGPFYRICFLGTKRLEICFRCVVEWFLQRDQFGFVMEHDIIDIDDPDDLIIRLMILSVYGFFVFGLARLIAEGQGWNKVRELGLGFGILAVLAYFVFFGSGFSEVWFLALMVPALLLVTKPNCQSFSPETTSVVYPVGGVQSLKFSNKTLLAVPSPKTNKLSTPAHQPQESLSSY